VAGKRKDELAAKRAERETEKTIAEAFAVIEELGGDDWNELMKLRIGNPEAYAAVETFGRLTPAQRRLIASLLQLIPDGQLRDGYANESRARLQRLEDARRLFGEEQDRGPWD
jgi:hypothetical protein